MDRKTWLAIGLSIVGILLWQWWYTSTYGPYLKEQERLQKEKTALAAAASPTPEVAATAATPTPLPTPQPSAMAARTETLDAGKQGNQAEFLFNNDTGGIETATLLKHLGENREVIGLNRDRRMPIGAISNDSGAALGGFQMMTDPAAGVVTFTRQGEDGVLIQKKFTLPPDTAVGSPYVVDLAITFQNTGATKTTVAPFYVSTGASAPVHEQDLPTYTQFYWLKDGKPQKIDVNWFNESKIPLVGYQIRDARTTYQENAPSVAWAAVTSQYFATIVGTSGEGTAGSAVWAARFAVPNEHGTTIYGMQGALGMAGFDLEPGASVTRTFQIYAGPKALSVLNKLGDDREAIMNFGMFGFVSKFLLWAMNLLHGLLGNYAAAIILLTLCIKTALWPLQNKATESMKRMSLLSPKMTELREKYKDDPTKMNEELMKLYKDYGVNPFSGCLPMMVQIPIFFGFYAMLGSAIELRNSSFLWVGDLSQPDTVAHFLGCPINILPLLMAGTMIWQMSITPKSGDATQQRMMMFMPIIFIVFAYNYASALSLYWTTQNLFSIVQLYLTRNRPLPTLEKKSVAAKRQTAALGKKKRPKR